MAVTPTEVHLRTDAKRLDIVWSDGREDRFALAYLRGWCPCAVCQGHFVTEKKFIAEASSQLMDVQPVGAYAMRLVWADGHDSGMYAFDYLREIIHAPPGDGPSNDALLTQP